jgi:hypothetical protein
MLTRFLRQKESSHLYEPGKRTGSWVKCRVNRGQELVIGGYIPGPHGFDSLIVGYYRGKDLVYVARGRNGFVPASRRQVFEKIRHLVSPTMPFVNLPDQVTAFTRRTSAVCDYNKGELYLGKHMVCFRDHEGVSTVSDRLNSSFAVCSRPHLRFPSRRSRVGHRFANWFDAVDPLQRKRIRAHLLGLLRWLRIVRLCADGVCGGHRVAARRTCAEHARGNAHQRMGIRGLFRLRCVSELAVLFYGPCHFFRCDPAMSGRGSMGIW